MEEFFRSGSQETILWFDNVNGEELPMVNESAFVKYIDHHHQPFEGLGSKEVIIENGAKNRRNMNKRMMEFLGEMWKPKAESMKMEKERMHRHMISERMRREKQKQSYEALHKLLPIGTKGDKNTIVQMAIARMQELQMQKEELMKRNNEIEMITLGARNNNNDNDHYHHHQAKINIKVDYPSCGIDSMLQVLNCLKNNGTKLRYIHFNFSPQQISTLLDIETKIGVKEVENEVQRSLIEVERNFQCNFSDNDQFN